MTGTRRGPAHIQPACSLATRLLFVLMLLPVGSAVAQVMIDLPADLAAAKYAAESAASNRVETETPAKDQSAPQKKKVGGPSARHAKRDVVNTINVEMSRGALAEFWEDFFDRPSQVDSAHYITIPPIARATASTLTLSAFDGSAASGAVRTGTTWVGNVTQGPGYITVGGGARDDNGWGASNLSLNATGMSYLNIIAQRDPGNATSSLFVQFEDRSLNTSVFSISTSAFALGSATQAQIIIGAWPTGFDPTQISSWSIGGGGVGTVNFNMTLFDLAFGTAALSGVPEPASVAAVMGTAALGLASFWRRRRRHGTSTGE